MFSIILDALAFLILFVLGSILGLLLVVYLCIVTVLIIGALVIGSVWCLLQNGWRWIRG